MDIYVEYMEINFDPCNIVICIKMNIKLTKQTAQNYKSTSCMARMLQYLCHIETQNMSGILYKMKPKNRDNTFRLVVCKKGEL